MDINHPPIGERQRRSILEAIRAGGDTTEKHYLEVKSTLDLTSKQDCAKVAKFILGAANRSPEMAARAFGGYAVMVIGAQQGLHTGVRKGVEILELEHKITKYLGQDGPVWDLEREQADEEANEVLFLLVYPPEEGHPPFACRAEFQGTNPSGSLGDGDIYVRSQGQTRKARSADIDALTKRVLQKGLPAPDFGISISGNAFHIEPSKAHLERVITHQIEQAREKYVHPPEATSEFGDAFDAHVLLRSIYKGPTGGLSVEAFERAAARWTSNFRSSWPSILNTLAGGVLPCVTIDVVNAESVFLEAVRVDLTFENAIGLDPTDSESLSLSDLIPPVIKKARDPFSLEIPTFIPPPLLNRGTYPLSWENGQNEVRVTVELEHLRPGTPWVSDGDDFVVLARSTAVPVKWRATARGFHRAFEGELLVSVDETHDFQSLLRLLPNEKRRR